MNNRQIIQNEAVASGYMSAEEVERLMAEGKEIPFHTYAMWKQKGLIPKEGSHGWQAKLWRKRPARPDGSGKDPVDQGFFLQKCFLFHISQCEKLKAEEVTS